MKNTRLTIFLFVSIALPASYCSNQGSGKDKPPEQYTTESKILHDTIARLDSVFFGAFNNRNIDTLQSLIDNNLEFYHDLGGVTNYEQNIAAFKRTFASERKLRRELVSLEVYPIKDYGAAETGVHRFYATEKGQQEKLSSEARFVQLWQQRDGKWKLTRIISYGHQEYLK